LRLKESEGPGGAPSRWGLGRLGVHPSPKGSEAFSQAENVLNLTCKFMCFGAFVRLKMENF